MIDLTVLYYVKKIFYNCLLTALWLLLKWLLLKWQLLGWLQQKIDFETAQFASFEQVKIDSHFAAFGKVMIDGYFAETGQAKTTLFPLILILHGKKY